MNRISTLASAALVLLASSACSDLPLTPAGRERDLALHAALVPRPDGLSCTETDARLSSGALFEVCVRPDAWNGDVVVFIPGYHDPANALALPEDLTASSTSFLFTQLGYAFASTSFRGSGLVEPDSWIGGDLLELVGTAKTLLHNTTGRGTRFVYQTGGSQGGLGTVMAVERYPGTFSGGLAACGPIGDYRKQIDYVADFRAVFDYSFAPVIAGWPVWRQELPANPGFIDPSTWAMAQQSSGAALDDPSNAARIGQVLSVTRAPIDPNDPRTIKATTLGLLWYSFRGTNDAILKLDGMPFGNVDRVYRGSLDDAALNAGVERFAATADPTLVAKLQTSGNLRRPLVTIHTTGDPVVPIWHESLYRNKLSFFGKLLDTPITIHRYGHCNFTDAEVLAAFAVLVLKVTGVNLLASSRVLPQPRAQQEFLRLARQHGANPVVMH